MYLYSLNSGEQVEKQAYVGYFHKKIFELNTTPKHFECKLSKHL